MRNLLPDWIKRREDRHGYRLIGAYARTDPKDVRDVARLCLERCRNMRWHPNIEDQLALEFFLGASVGAVAAGSTLLANRIAWAATNIVAKHGMRGIAALERGEADIPKNGAN